jgi:hypothetical protein
MAGSLDDNPPKLFGGREYEYMVLSTATTDGAARIFVSQEGVMTRQEIAAQLRRLADYVDSLTDEQAHRP